MADKLNSWAELYDRRAQLFNDPLDICEFYVGENHTDSAWFRCASEHISGRLQLDPLDNVLEVGCGCGVIMQTLLGRAAHFTGVDPAPGVITKARESLPGQTFETASIEQLPFPDDSFDKAYSYQVFHYLGSLDTAGRGIQELKRVVRPGGRILLGQIPNADREADYQQHRQTRDFSRSQQIEHQLRWLWYAPEFFEQFRDDFSEVSVDTSEHAFDPNYRWRMDVLLIV